MRTVVGLYDQFEDAHKAIGDLHNAGFRGEDVSLIARDTNGVYSRSLPAQEQEQTVNADAAAGAGDSETTGAGIGALLGGLSGLLIGLGAMAVPGIGPVIAAGPVVKTLAGAGVGAVTGGMVGALVNLGVPEDHSNIYAEGVRRGGSLVIVRVAEERVEPALSILNRYGPLDILRHARIWQEKKWVKFDPQAGPLIRSEMEFNRRSDIQDGERLTDKRPVNFPTSVDETELYIPEIDYGDLGNETVDQTMNESARAGLPVTGDMPDVSAPIEDVHQIHGDEFPRFEGAFRRHYQNRYGDAGPGYDIYFPAYRFGYNLAVDPRYYGSDWQAVEPIARRDWESRGERLTWDEVKDAVRFTWRSVTR